MKFILHNLSVITILAFTMLFTSCGKKETPESLTDEMVIHMKEMNDAMESVKDKETAAAAAKKIDEISDSMVSIAERFAALPEPSEDEKKKLREKMEQATKDQVYTPSPVEVDPEAMKIVMDATMRFAEKMEAHKETFEKFGLR